MYIHKKSSVLFHIIFLFSLMQAVVKPKQEISHFRILVKVHSTLATVWHFDHRIDKINSREEGLSLISFINLLHFSTIGNALPIYHLCMLFSRTLIATHSDAYKHFQRHCIIAIYHIVAVVYICVNWPHSILECFCVSQLAKAANVHNSTFHCALEFNVESGVRMEFALVFVRSVYLLLMFEPYICISLVVTFNSSIYLQNLYINAVYIFNFVSVSDVAVVVVFFVAVVVLLILTLCLLLLLLFFLLCSASASASASLETVEYRDY